MCKHRRAFTLVELLVVIAIIALLMSILMPALARVRKQAKDVMCRATLKQWGMVFSMYAGDYDSSTLSGPGIPGAEDWMCSLRPYYKENKLILCPSAVRPWYESGEWGKKDMAWYVEQGRVEVPCKEFAPAAIGSYGINDWCWNAPPEEEDTWGFALSWCWRSFNIKRASSIPILQDCLHLGSFPHHTDEPQEYEDIPWSSSSDAGMPRVNINRHGRGSINILFMDFTVRPVGLKELWTLKWNKQFITHGPWTKAGGVQPSDWPEWMQDFPEYKK